MSQHLISTCCARETDIVGYPILPLVHQMVKQCGDAGALCALGARPRRTSWTPP